MKNKILTLVFGIAVATAAHSEILYWTVQNYTEGTSYNDWSYARIFSSTGTKPGEALETRGEVDSYGYVAKKANDGVYTSYIDTDSYSAANSFYIELYSSQNSTAPYAWSYLVQKSALKAFVDEASFAQVPTNMVNGFTVVPEPTSGLMLLLGAAMLGLRRKRIA